MRRPMRRLCSTDPYMNHMEVRRGRGKGGESVGRVCEGFGECEHMRECDVESATGMDARERGERRCGRCAREL